MRSESTLESIAAPSGFWNQRILPMLSRLEGGRRLLPFCLTAGMLAVAALLHYGDMMPLLSSAADHSPVGLTTRQSTERILFLVPIIFATLAFGAQGGLATMTVGFALLLPRALMDSGHTDHALPEIAGVMVVGSLLIVVITQQRKDVETQTNLRESMRYFVRQVITSQEDERKRIAMELHDETAQDLLLACQRLDRLITREAQRLPEDVSSQLEILRSATVDTLTGLRRLTQHLRPRVFDDHGLVAAIEWLADSLQQEYGIAVRVDAGGPLPRQDADTQLILFRIAQEALHNSGRHSGATNVVVTLSYRHGRTTMAVSDNGRGFKPSEFAALAQRGKLGLLGMHERARLLGGALEISSLPGHGATITVRLPSDDLRRSAGPEKDYPTHEQAGMNTGPW